MYVELRRDSPESGTDFINLSLLSLACLSFSSLKITVWIDALRNVVWSETVPLLGDGCIVAHLDGVIGRLTVPLKVSALKLMRQLGG